MKLSRATDYYFIHIGYSVKSYISTIYESFLKPYVAATPGLEEISKKIKLN
jgi:hypothetical protein